METVRLRGHGDTIRYGLDHADGDILVVVEGDYSFRARDLGKLLEYLKDADMVVGAHTTREMIEQGTNMRGPVRWGNVVVAKLVELMWWNLQPRFTGVGCTYRALWRDAYQKMRPLLSGVGPDLSPKTMAAAGRARARDRGSGKLSWPAGRRIQALGQLLAHQPHRVAHAAHDPPAPARMD